MSEIWGIILAAGESTRMKTQKLLLPFQGTTILGTVIENLSRSKIDKSLMVIGCDRDEILKSIENYSISHYYNENYKQGMLSSVKTAFRSLPETFEAVLIFPGDQPLITPEAINSVITAYRESRKGIVIPVFEKKRGHPLLVDRKYREEVEKLADAEGLRGLSRKFPDDVLEVEVGLPGILRDIDTPEEYLESIKSN